MSEAYDEDLFQAWLEVRAEIHGAKVNKSQRSVKMARDKLEAWHLIGYNCNAILKHAAEVGWRGLYLPQGMVPKQQHRRPAGAAKDLVDQINVSIPRPAESKQQKADRIRGQGQAAQENLNRIRGLLAEAP